MKTTLTMFVLAFAVLQSIQAQDLIVTKKNDSISCKIMKLKKDNIYFVFKNNDIYQSTLLPEAEVASYSYDFFENDPIPKDSLPGFVEQTGFRLAFNGGYSYDPAKISNSTPVFLEEFTKQLRSGYHIEGSAIYFFDRIFGIGLKYNLFKTKNTLNNVIFTNTDGSEIIGTLENDISVSFVGLVLATRLLGKKSNNAVLINSAIGYLSYQDDQLLAIPIKSTGNALGINTNVGYDYELSDNFFVGVQVGITSGRIKELDIESSSGTETVELPDDERPWGSARIDFSFGVRYHL